MKVLQCIKINYFILRHCHYFMCFSQCVFHCVSFVPPRGSSKRSWTSTKCAGRPASACVSATASSGTRCTGSTQIWACPTSGRNTSRRDQTTSGGKRAGGRIEDRIRDKSWISDSDSVSFSCVKMWHFITSYLRSRSVYVAGLTRIIPNFLFAKTTFFAFCFCKEIKLQSAQFQTLTQTTVIKGL